MTAPRAAASKSLSFVFTGLVLLIWGTAAQSDTTVLVQRDSYIKSGQSDKNEGASHVLRVDKSGKNRTLVAFGLGGINPSQVVSATLELTVSDSKTWGSGRPVNAHRVTAPWVEGNAWTEGNNIPGNGAGVTWNCASDAEVSNAVADCASQWGGGTFAPTPTASVLHTNALIGTIVRWTVTADVVGLPTGAQEISWILKKQDETLDGRADYISKEAALNLGDPRLAPRLVLVGPPNRPPTAATDIVAALAGQATLIDVLANDSDPDGNALTLLSVDAPATVVGNKVQVTLTTPGNHVFEYRIQDVDASPFTVNGLIGVAVGTTGETRVLTAVGDSFLKQGSPDENQGANSKLQVASNDRTVATFDLTGIDPVRVRSASLELRVSKSLNWGTSGRYVGVHRLLDSFQEGNGSSGSGVTWNCAVDANIGNTLRDCASPWFGGRYAIATAPPFLQKNATTGVVRWDVFGDLRAAGSAPAIGFLIKKVNEAADGTVQYDSRSSGGTPPRLVLELVHLPQPPPDLTPPTVTAPPSLVVAAVNRFGTPRSSGEISNFLSSATAIDDVDPSVAVTNDAPDPFPLGTTVVTFYASDSSGNTATDSASITVEDQTPPVVTPPISITVNSPDGTPVPDTDLEIATFLLSARATDNVDGPLPLLHDAPSQFFPETTTLVTFRATDAAGLMQQASAAVVVTHILITPTPQTGTNVNMVSGQEFITGDPFLQRQNEPSLAVSTRNSMHLLGGANDYRTVDIPGLLDDEVTGDAWLGVFKSFDGGEKWISTLVPGFPQDTSAEGFASPLKDFHAGADPVVRSGAGGIFYFSGLVFNRGPGQPSQIFVARFVDNNNSESADAIQYVNASTVDIRLGPNAVEFLDKPWMAVDIPRSEANPCFLDVPQPIGERVQQEFPGGNVYVAYAAVTGEEGGAEEASRILLNRSTNCGMDWDGPIQISAAGSRKNQGATMAIDPETGRLYIAWRRFSADGETDAILFRASFDGGQTFGPVRQVSQLAPFDQQTVDQSNNLLRFRTNAYPTMTVDGDGRIYLAYSERGFAPTPTPDARIVMTTSMDGMSWTPRFAVDNSAVPGHQMMPTLAFSAGKLFLSYYDFRDDISGSFEAFVDDTPLQPSRHTVDVRTAMAIPDEKPIFTVDSALSRVPSVRASKYNGFFNEDARVFEQEQFNFPNLPLFRLGTAPFVGDYIDVAASPPFVPAGDGTWRYNLDPDESPVFHLAWTDGRDVRPPADGNWADYTPPNSDLSSACIDFRDAGMRDQNIYTARITEGLYVGSPVNTKPLVDDSGEPIQRSYILFVQNATSELRAYRLFIANQPPDSFGPDHVGRASFKQFPLPRYNADSEPALTQLLVLVPPRSSIARTVYVSSTIRLATIRVDVVETAIAGTDFVPKLQRSVLLNPDLLNPDLLNPDLLNRETHNVSIVRTSVSNPDLLNENLLNPDMLNPDLLNPDMLNPDLLNPDMLNPDLLNPDLLNPDALNKSILNPDMLNPNLINPDLLNPDLINPDLLNAELTDITYVIKNTGNTTTTYSFVGLLDHVPAKAFKYQLLIYKRYTTPIMDQSCNLTERERHELVANVTGMRNPDLLNPDMLNPDLLNPHLLTPDLLNPDMLNPDMLNPDMLNPDLLNASIADGSFFLEENQEAYVTVRFLDPDKNDGVGLEPEDFTPVVVAQTVNTEDAKEGYEQPPVASGENNPLSIYTPALPQGTLNVPYPVTFVALGADGPVNWTAALPPGLTVEADTGKITGAPTQTGVFTVAVSAHDGSEMATKTLELEVTSNQLRFTVQPVSADAGATITPAVVVTILDGAGNPVASSDDVSLEIGNNSGAGALSGTTTRMAVGGIATFPGLSIDKAGTGYTLFASADGLKSAVSHPFDVNGTSATKLGFLLHPASVTPLAPFSVQVAVLDSFGNIRTDANDLVTLAIGANPGGATLYGPQARIAVNGIATFHELGIAVPATGYALVATAAGLTGAVSNPFDINASPPAKLSITVQPTDVDAGQPIMPAVEVEILDASNNPVPTATNLVTLGIASNPGGGSLSGVSSVEAVNGVASFPAISINQPGAGYTLMALSAGLTPATSADFDVVLTGPFAYVSTGGNAISVIDLSTNSVVAEIPIGGNLQRLSVSPDGETVYALTPGGISSAIVVVDATTNQVETSVSAVAGSGARDIALMPDGSILYVAVSGFPGRIVLFDTATNSMLPTDIFVDDLPVKLAISPFGTHLYVVHATGAIAVVDTATNSVVATTPSAGLVDAIRAFALSPDGTKGYVTHLSPSPGVYVFDTASQTAITDIPAGGGPFGLAFTFDGRRAYVPNSSPGYVSVIDTATDTVTETIPVAGSPTFAAMSPVGDQVYVANGGSNSVTVIDTGTNTVVDSVNLAGLPGDIAVRPFEISTFAVTSVADGGPGSLRQAFLDANANAGPDYIEFDIPSPGPHTISPLSPLPALTSPVRLDATTEPDYADTPMVEIEGSSAGAGAVGIELRTGTSLVNGFAINRFGGAGIILSGGGNNEIHGNHVGTDVTGSVDRGNGAQGLLIENSRNNDVLGSLLGPPTNVFSGNGGVGVEIAGSRATGNRVRANRIGTDLGGTSPIGNDGGGVRVSAPGNTIGGPSVFDRNIISGNDGDGILLDEGSDNSTVHAQLIGVDLFGTSALGNAGWGIWILSDGNSIGGLSSFNRNVISGNGLGGLRVEGNNNAIHDNAIGTDLAGSLTLGNSGPGVEIAGGSDNQMAILGNHIAHNSGDGVVILAGERNSLALNVIHSNGGLGIDLGGDGVTANDAGGDPDGGPNTLLNFPVITSATTGAFLTVDATFHSTPSTQFNIRFYRSSVCDPSGNGEGEVPMAAINLLTGATGDAFINGMTFPPVPAGEFITALASDTLGNTSEFSACVLVTP